MFLFRWIGSFFSAIGGLFAPMFTMAKGLANPKTSTTKWILHGLLVAATLILLTVIQYYFDIGRYVSAPHPLLRQAWLPLVGLALYVNLWLIWLVWRLYDPHPPASAWPDIDYAWTQITGALLRAGIEPSKVPLFLVLGRPDTGANVLFESARIPLDLNGIPEAQLAPLKVYAGKQAIFIVCTDTCLLGAFGDRVSTMGPSYLGTSGTLAGPIARTFSTSGVFPVKLEAPNSGVFPAKQDAPNSGVLPAKQDAPNSGVFPAKQESSNDNQGQGLGNLEESKPITRDSELMTRMQSRLDHVCRLIRGMRHPWCTVNGILLVMPEQATSNDFLATQAAILAQQDLSVAQHATGVECPVIAVFAGTEEIPGFREFLSLIPRDKRDQRLGKPIPMALVKGPERRSEIIAKTIYWQCAELIPKLIIRTFQLRPLDPVTGRGGNMQLDLRTNRQLIRLIRAIWSRRQTMGRLCTRLIEGQTETPTRLTGCYFAATGSAKRGQGFLTDLFAQLFEGQNFVTWTAEATRVERTMKLVTLAGYVFTVLVTAFTIFYGLGFFRLG